MRRAFLVCLLAAEACVDPQAAETGFCLNRPGLCLADAGEADAGSDAGVDAGPGCPRNDEFESASWNSCFTSFEPPTSDPVPRLENGALVFDQLGPNLGWSNGNIGSLLSQEFTGNFVAEVRARVVLPADGGRLGAYTAAALLAGDPASPQISNRLVSVGTLGGFPDGGNEYGVLSELTQQSSSQFRAVPTGTTEALLRLCRVGESWFAYTHAVDGGPWAGFPLFAPDAGFTLPATVRVGPAAYNVGGPTARIEHDYFRFSTAVTSQLECASLPVP